MKLEASPLRDDLQRITDRQPAENESVEDWLEKQVQEIELLKREYDHEIALAVFADRHTQQHNCFSWALGIDVEMRPVGGPLFPPSAFVADLVGRQMLPPAFDRREGQVVVYYDGQGQPRHAGKVDGARVVSKWGARATHVWTHGVDEVPSSYGIDARFYGRPVMSPDALFADWVKSKPRAP